MDVSAYSNGCGWYGIKIGKRKREEYFDRTWREIRMEVGGHVYTFTLPPSFWHECAEIRDSGGIIRDWLQQRGAIPWPKGKPPHFQLIPTGAGSFRLQG